MQLSCVGSVCGGTGHSALGVSIGSTHTELHRFLMIFEFGQGVRPVQSWSKRAILEAAYPCTSVFSSFLTASIRGRTSGLSLSGRAAKPTTAQAAKVCTRRCICCHSALVSATVEHACCRLLSNDCSCRDFRFKDAVASEKMLFTLRKGKKKNHDYYISDTYSFSLCAIFLFLVQNKHESKKRMMTASVQAFSC